MPRTRIALSMLAALVAAPFAAGAAEVKIGYISTFSGPEANNGALMDRGIQLYLKQHPQVPGGHKIEMLKRDDTGPNAATAKRLAEELVARDKVDMLTGIIYSNNAFAIMDVCKQAKVPVLIMNAGTASITEQCPYVARVSFTMWQAGYPMGDYAAKKMGIKTAAIAYANYAPGKDSTNAFKVAFEKAGGKVVADVPFPFPNLPDFTPFMQKIKDLKPDAVYVFVPAAKWATGVMKTYNDLQMRQAGIKLIGPGDITTDTELPNMGDIPLGVITVHHYSAVADRPENKAFVKAYKEAYGDSNPDFLVEQGYAGMAAIYHVIEKTNGKITAEGFINALKGWKYNAPRGPIMIDPDTRDIVDNQYVREVKKVDGKLVNVEFDTIPMVKDPYKALGKK
ncbi:MAG TPA: ABC transporter substrate-binding protein [Alphaproteobacteria bacterium]